MPSRLTKTLKLFLILLIPIVIIATVVSLLVTDQYLAFEYGKASFPPDPFGFTGQQRFELASSNIHYVRAHRQGDVLSGQTLNGSPVYNPREVTHMTDVQAVFQAVLRVWQVAFVLLLFLGFILWQNRQRMALASAIQSGGFLTSGIILMIAMLASSPGKPGSIFSIVSSSCGVHGCFPTLIRSSGSSPSSSGLMQP